MTEHPPSYRVDALAAGDADPNVLEHVATCAHCKRHFDAALAATAAFRAEEGADRRAFVRRLRGRAAESEPASPVPATMQSEARSWRRRSRWIAAAAVAAAATLLLFRSREKPPIALPVAGDPVTRFKGKIQLAAVRDRNGDQARTTSEVRVRPGDRLRAEIGIDDTRPLEVGFLGNDDSWVLLVAPRVVEPGTHFSERAARFDESPTEGLIIVGHPDAVERARRTRVFDEVGVLPVVVEP